MAPFSELGRQISLMKRHFSGLAGLGWGMYLEAIQVPCAMVMTIIAIIQLIAINHLLIELVTTGSKLLSSLSLLVSGRSGFEGKSTLLHRGNLRTPVSHLGLYDFVPSNAISHTRSLLVNHQFLTVP